MSRTILSINGNKPMNYMLQTVLSRKYKIAAVGDVFQGMQQLRTNEAIELILVDVDFNTAESWEFIQHKNQAGFTTDRLWYLPAISCLPQAKK